MNASAFRDLWAILRTFKTSRVTINHEMHEQVHTIVLFIIFSTKLLKRATLYALRTT